MTRAFLGGPIDYRPLSEVVEYRLRLSERLEAEGFELVDQYSGALGEVADVEFGPDTDLDAVRSVIDDLPDEPYVEAIRHAIDEHSLLEVVQSPELVPQEMPEETVEALVARDLELVETADVMLAYLPRPSCGTMTELLHAHEQGLPVVVLTESPPTFVRYYADEVAADEDEAIATLGEYASR